MLCSHLVLHSYSCHMETAASSLSRSLLIWKKVGVLGFPMESVPVYTKPLNELGLTVELIDAELQARLNAAIIALMEGRVFDNAAEDAVTMLRQKGVDGIILGCTEIPLLLGDKANEADLISPIVVLAEAAVKFAMD